MEKLLTMLGVDATIHPEQLLLLLNDISSSSAVTKLVTNGKTEDVGLALLVNCLNTFEIVMTLYPKLKHFIFFSKLVTRKIFHVSTAYALIIVEKGE